MRPAHIHVHSPMLYIQTKQTKRKGTANADAIFVNANSSLTNTSRFGDTGAVENIVADAGVFISPLYTLVVKE